MTYLRPVVLVRGSLESNLDFEGNLDRLLRVVEQCSSLHDVLAHPLLTCWQRHPTGRNQGARGCAMDGEAEDADMRLEEAVSLLTIHKAKGLEWESVYLPGWEEGTFPSKVATGRLDEEYRLAYVALTRCRKLAAITYSRRRLQRGRWRRREPSAFLQVLPSSSIVSFAPDQSRPYLRGNAGFRASSALIFKPRQHATRLPHPTELPTVAIQQAGGPIDPIICDQSAVFKVVENTPSTQDGSLGRLPTRPKWMLPLVKRVVCDRNAPFRRIKRDVASGVTGRRAWRDWTSLQTCSEGLIDSPDSSVVQLAQGGGVARSDEKEVKETVWRERVAKRRELEFVWRRDHIGRRELIFYWVRTDGQPPMPLRSELEFEFIYRAVLPCRTPSTTAPIGTCPPQIEGVSYNAESVAMGCQFPWNEKVVSRDCSLSGVAAADEASQLLEDLVDGAGHLTKLPHADGEGDGLGTPLPRKASRRRDTRCGGQGGLALDL
uniref:UvrD-like helicase C-terminal domain-containing protein n=1 Tax=Haptolina ericina TaxID=156174 RepID=A0A7S3EUG7_9EUKA|mmetsp:Transcript_24884/g.56720  ORF Transcript_24884/g.56720 Transcript_24884/m.56720 type:complete len:490 (+) Transcript_24884:799-2268(+)